jgi:hypothetical protein
MKTSIRTIGIALLVLSAFVGFAAADVSEPPDAGSPCSNGRWFDAPVGYTFIEGTLNNPSDSADAWKSSTPDVGDTLHIFLDSHAYNRYVSDELFKAGSEDPGNLMQRVQKGNMSHVTAELGEKPICINVSAPTPASNGAYTTILQREV